MNRALLIALLLASTLSAQVPVVQIVSPAPGATLSGVVTISGTTTGISSGLVAVAIDGPPFTPATGVTSWSFSWDTTTVPDGQHVITARARECLGCPVDFDNVTINVSNAPPGPSVAFLQPAPGSVVLDTLTVLGSSNNATAVTLSVDGGPHQAVNGLDPWNAVFEPGSLTPGPHTLTARATDGVAESFATLSITVGSPPPGLQPITYSSSVDAELIDAQLFVPNGLSSGSAPRPLVIWLHGGGGNGANMGGTEFVNQLDARGWLGIAPAGRRWGLAQQGCNWQWSAAYVNNPDPDVGPGEQDIFDAIDWVKANYPVNTNRIYLCGFSMGGRGTYIIGLKNPGYFAAIGPLGPAIDMYEVQDRRPEPGVCKAGMAGGLPGDSPWVDTMWTITSGRFLIENAYNLPVYHGHGLDDTVASNTTTESPFLHGFHITTDTNWSGCHGTTNYCFGHTPTLSELKAHHPDGYDWAYMFTPHGHSVDPLWLESLPQASVPTALGTPDPNVPGNLLGLFDFLAARTRVHNPPKILYKTYTDTHREAYWLALDTAVPWTDVPAAVRAERRNGQNRIDVELVRAAAITFDLDRANLELDATRPLTINLSELVDATYDPALAAPGETQSPEVRLVGDFSGLSALQVLQDGVELPANLVQLNSDLITIGPIPLTAATQLRIFACNGWFEHYGAGSPGTAGLVPHLSISGCPTPGETLDVGIINGLGGAPAWIGVGTQRISVAHPAGTLLAGPVHELGFFPLDLNGSGAGQGTMVLSFPLPVGMPPLSVTAQGFVLDAGSAGDIAFTEGLEINIQ